MNTPKKGMNTRCTHAGQIEDTQFLGSVSPLFMASSYAYEHVDEKRYPRYFNTPNQQALARKVASLENCEAGLIFGSGMAAISTAFLAFLKAGDHVVLQKTIYGGTFHFVNTEFKRLGVTYSFTDGLDVSDFRSKIQDNTRIIYLETPSNPLMEIVDIEAVAKLAQKHGLTTFIDNTFASPINQNPHDFGIDIILHSATKYMGGHSDICAGTVSGTAAHIEQIMQTARNYGGSLSDYTVWLLERSMKTMALRVKAQNRNAKKIAKWLNKHPLVAKVYYPGLKTHPNHEIAKKQMRAYTGMLCFELVNTVNLDEFINNLKLIKPSMSLAGVESTILVPAKTSHALLGEAARQAQGISESLLRFSVGIENTKDLIADLTWAFEAATKPDIKNANTNTLAKDFVL